MLQQLLKNYFLACAFVLNGCSVGFYFALYEKVYTQYLTCEGSLNILTMASHMYWTLAPSAARRLLNQKF